MATSTLTQLLNYEFQVSRQLFISSLPTHRPPPPPRPRPRPRPHHYPLLLLSPDWAQLVDSCKWSTASAEGTQTFIMGSSWLALGRFLFEGWPLSSELGPWLFSATLLGLELPCQRLSGVVIWYTVLSVFFFLSCQIGIKKWKVVWFIYEISAEVFVSVCFTDRHTHVDTCSHSDTLTHSLIMS